MLKKFLSFSLTGYVALALFACDDDSNSFQAPEQDPPQVGTESSSSEATEISSSSLETSVESSSSQNSAASSSSQESAVSSSSEESVLQSSVSEIRNASL